LSGLLHQSRAVDWALGKQVDRLLANDGAVRGIASGADEVTAPAVVLATGGMSASYDMLAQYYPRSLSDAAGQVRYVGLPTARGDAVRLAASLGAQVVGHNRGSRVPQTPFGGLYLPSFVLVVNQLGRRYFDETTFPGASERLLEAQPGAVAYVIIDDATRREFTSAALVRPHFKTSFGAHVNYTVDGIGQLVKEGKLAVYDSVAELAAGIRVPLANLDGTLERYNRMVHKGRDEDYLKASSGLRLVSAPPFYVGTMRLPELGLTGVGLRIDHDAHVLHETSLAIEGLFAAGEAAGGVIGDVYAGAGNAIAAATVFGRVAGRTAAQKD
jgi:fumarate reductase flavoprotein subunit